jgi:hypothetical protein
MPLSHFAETLKGEEYEHWQHTAENHEQLAVDNRRRGGGFDTRNRDQATR